MTRLAGKVAIVTGGGNGIGRAISTRMAEEGAAIAVVDLDKDAARQVADALTNSGAQAMFAACDVTQEDQVADTVAMVAERFGRVDVLVNNAAAVLLCTKHVVAQLKRVGGGSIINISSICDLVDGGDIPPYHASKSAVRLMSKNDARIYAGESIRVNSIHPGSILTSKVRRCVTDSGPEMDATKPVLDVAYPLGGSGEPDDIAWGAVFLASDQARWVTGAELVIDGGYTPR